MRKQIFSSAFLAIVLSAVGLTLSNPALAKPKKSAGSGYHVTDSITIGGTGKWDYLSFDGVNRVLYVAHGDEIDAIDPIAKLVLAKIPAQGSHGVAIANEFNRGFFTNGKTNTVGVFDLKTHGMIQEVPVGQKPDAIVYDSATKHIFAMCGGSNGITVLEAATGLVTGTIELGGGPEFGVADGKGHVFVNIEDKSETVMLDAQKMTIAKRWKIAPGEEPSGLAMDIKHNRLFAGCHNKKMMAIDAKTGKILAAVPIGSGVDANGFDPGTQFAFSSNGDATLTIAKDVPHKGWTVIDNVPTELGARTMAIDPLTHAIYMPTASFGDTPAATAEHPHPRPLAKEGTFRILVLTR